MARSSLLVLAACLAAALGFSPAGVPVRQMAVGAPAASSVVMTKCSGGGDGAPKGDKKRRGKVKSLIAKADSAESFKSLVLTPTTESILLKMNWKTRMSMQYPIKRRAAEFGVEVPASFASWQLRPRNTPPHKLTTSF